MRWFHPAHPPRYDQQVARTKRQAGLESFEFSSEEEETGDWSDWGAPSGCSRTCGGGVSTEERTCSGSCTGPDKRFSSCNLPDCPRGSRDFREEQCAEYNSQLFERKYYDWIPYLKAPRKCELNCMPKGERFYYRHAKKVREEGETGRCLRSCWSAGC